MLSLREVQRAARILNQSLSGALLQRVVQLDECRLVLTFYGSGESCHLLLNCAPGFARLSVLEDSATAPAVPPAFAQYLRAHLGRAVLMSMRTADHDRLVRISLKSRDRAFVLVFSIMGNRSNVYLLDGDGVLLYPMRRLDETRSDLAIGRPWADPPQPLRTEGTDRWEDRSDQGFLAAVQEAYASLERRKEFDALARRLEHALTKETAFLERKAGNLSEDLNEAVNAEEYRRKGDLLKAVLHTIQPGDESARAFDHEAGQTVVIPLNPQLSPPGNLEAYFRRYHKELRGADAIRLQLDKLRCSQVAIVLLQERLQNLVRMESRSLEDLLAFEQEPAVRRLVARFRPARPAGRPPRPVTKGKNEVPSRLTPRRFRGEHGLEIWVGRSDEGNDYLTTRLARGNDLFFHLEGYPGSHVVLRTEGQSNPPSEAILDACELAVHYSKLKEARRADVHIVPVKNVRKPKGAKSGLVHVTKGKTIHLRRDPRRLENILASRLDA